jgi:hypothetical protein
MQIHEAVSLCHKNGIKVYPQMVNKQMFLVIEQNDKVKVGTIPQYEKTINKAMSEMYIRLAFKIKANS